MKYNPAIVIAFFRASGLPEAALEFRFHETRKWRFDFAWPAENVALEVQGGLFIGGGHNRGAYMVKEHDKRNEAAARRWVIFYVQPKELCTKATVDYLKRALYIAP